MLKSFTLCFKINSKEKIIKLKNSLYKDLVNIEKMKIMYSSDRQLFEKELKKFQDNRLRFYLNFLFNSFLFNIQKIKKFFNRYFRFQFEVLFLMFFNIG